MSNRRGYTLLHYASEVGKRRYQCTTTVSNQLMHHEKRCIIVSHGRRCYYLHTSHRNILQQKQVRNHSSSSKSYCDKGTNNSGAPKSFNPNAVEGVGGDGSALQQTQSSPAISSSTSKQQHNDLLRKRRRRQKPFSYVSPLSQISSNHPKHNSTTLSDNNKILTRKQLLRLTPKQRATLKAQRIQQYKDSQTYLDQARTNVRSNIKFLSETADTNFKKNIQTIKRLFKGEEVWKDVEQQSTTTTASAKQREEESLTKGIDWERAPSEIKSNLQLNLSRAQNWLHDATNGAIPSSSYVNNPSSNNITGEQGGSVATRIHKFHQMKQWDTKWVMDNKWIGKNILIALLPGTLFHLYFLSLQDEMKEYYERVEKAEREKIMGYTNDAEGGSVDVANRLDITTTNNNDEEEVGRGRMGISSAFITEGGSAWDKLKMVVTDLFLGGAEDKINKQLETQQRKQQEDEAYEKDDTSKQPRSATDTPKQSVVPATNSPTGNYSSSETSTTPLTNNNNNNNNDPTIEMLLERVQALERQLGTTTSNDPTTSNHLSEEELQQQNEKQRYTEHQLKRRIERLRQSPIRNRREDTLEAQWREEARKEQSNDDARVTIKVDDTNNSSYSIADVLNFATSLIEPSFDSMRETAMQKMKDVMGVFGLSAEEKESAANDELDHSNTSSSTDQSNEGTVVLANAEVHDSAGTDSDASTAINATQQSGENNEGVRRWVAKVWCRFRKPPTHAEE